MNTILLIAFLLMLLLITITDIKKRQIPNRYVTVIGIIAIMATVFQNEMSLPNRFIGLLVVSLPLLIITMIVPNAFGGGDIKLMAASGFYLGLELILLSFFFAVLSGGLYGVWLLVVKKKGRKEYFAFGPFLCGGMVFAVFFGAYVLERI